MYQGKDWSTIGSDTPTGAGWGAMQGGSGGFTRGYFVPSSAGAGARLAKRFAAAPKGGPFRGGGLWNTIDEVVDPSVVRQLNGGSRGPSCGAMLMRGTGNPAPQSAIALRQGAVMSDDAARLASAMNELGGNSIWRGGFINVFTNPSRTFCALSRNGAFATTLRTPAMKVSHMVVVDGLDDVGRVIIRDPLGGTRYLMKWDDFIKVWEGQSVYR